MSNEVERARSSRYSGVVLKVALSNIRARDRTVPILVLEGTSDVGPYQIWIARIRGNWPYHPLPGNGKPQLLELRRSLRSDTTGLRKGVYFFVDRDFDDLRGDPAGPDLYCTDAYSIENDLVSEDVIRGILLDEFKWAAEKHIERDIVQVLYRTVRDQFAQAMRGANWRIYRARRLGIDILALPEAVTKYVSISVCGVTERGNADLRRIVLLKREPSQDESAAIDVAFSQLDPIRRHRGKFWVSFLIRWLDEVSKECRTGAHGIFSGQFACEFSSHSLTLSSMAARSPLPAGLTEFVSQI